MKASERAREHRIHELPYGICKLPSGRTFLFNRRYKPLWERQPDGRITEADRDEWVTEWEEQHGVRECNHYFYYDGTPERERVRAAEAALAAFERGEKWEDLGYPSGFLNRCKMKMPEIKRLIGEG